MSPPTSVEANESKTDHLDDDEIPATSLPCHWKFPKNKRGKHNMHCTEV